MGLPCDRFTYRIPSAKYCAGDELFCKQVRNKGLRRILVIVYDEHAQWLVNADVTIRPGTG
ncbi:hypothetical protein PAMC26577_11545 [Caballeronia sordidicola]|uniref:Uncharacterized protein n=1 Tax=Caballeronia sordidicola TaxID=196367 RepID=A0A242MXU1_CABSO|nr:hypothetical protein PAMC26577_11545 [Caballeronia sordidicola]